MSIFWTCILIVLSVILVLLVGIWLGLRLMILILIRNLGARELLTVSQALKRK